MESFPETLPRMQPDNLQTGLTHQHHSLAPFDAFTGTQQSDFVL